MDFREEKIVELISKYHKGILTDSEKKELISFYNTDAENRKLVNAYYRLYIEGRSAAFVQNIDKEKAWNGIHKRITKKKGRFRRLHAGMLAAAVAAVVFGVSIFFTLHLQEREIDSKNYEKAVPVCQSKATLILSNGTKINLSEDKDKWLKYDEGVQISKSKSDKIVYKTLKENTSKVVYNTIIVPRGGEYNLTLSDGTRVKLNADSKLKYPVNFAGNKREVFLSGEGYFNVKYNKKAPFFVRVSDVKIKVLGTKFNVSGYADEEIIAATLVKGSIEVDVLGKTKRLKPNYQLSVKRGTTDMIVDKVDVKLYTSWTAGIYEFENTRLEHIAAQLGRWYNVEFFFTNNKLKDIRFTGAVKRNKSINYALGMIERITDVKFNIKDNYIIIE